MPRDAVSRTANVERTGRHKWVKLWRDTAVLEHRWRKLSFYADHLKGQKVGLHAAASQNCSDSYSNLEFIPKGYNISLI